MKSYKHLYEQFLSEENYLKAVEDATKHKSGRKRKYRQARYLKEHPLEFRDKILEYAAHFKNEQHTPKEIYDGISKKKRIIIVPSIWEQVVHHMVINVLKPILSKGMYEHSYGSIPDRGPHKGKKYIEKLMKRDPKNFKYCLNMDIRKFFDSIPHVILKERFAELIHDQRFLQVIYEIIDVTERGIPLGFYTSQWIANWYLTKFDHFVKEKLHCKYYFRYMDDMNIFDGNKKFLHDVRASIQKYLQDHLGLTLKRNWQVFLFHFVTKSGKETGRDLDFMGFRFFRNRTTLRKGIMLKATRKARRMCRKQFKTIYDCRQMLSYLGYIDCTDTYAMYLKYIKPFVAFGKLKKYISKYEKKRGKKLCGNKLKIPTVPSQQQGS